MTANFKSNERFCVKEAFYTCPPVLALYLPLSASPCLTPGHVSVFRLSNLALCFVSHLPAVVALQPSHTPHHELATLRNHLAARPCNTSSGGSYFVMGGGGRRPGSPLPQGVP